MKHTLLSNMRRVEGGLGHKCYIINTKDVVGLFTKCRNEVGKYVCVSLSECVCVCCLLWT